MDWILYIAARGLVAFIQALPLRVVARLGRMGGGLACRLDARHRRVAHRNIQRCFPELSPAEVRSLVEENFRRIGENYACGIRTAGMKLEELKQVVEFDVPDELARPVSGEVPKSVVVAIGHFGNFEIHAHFNMACPGYQGASTYRALGHESADRVLKTLREQSGCLFFERRFDGAKLRAAMSRPGIMLGLLSDQDGGDRGLQLPFLGHNCSTSPAAAVFALRYGCPLYTAICYRVELGRWRIECGDEIPTHEGGQPRSSADIMRDVNAALGTAVRRDPANWFWVHNRWKRGKPTPESETAGG